MTRCPGCALELPDEGPAPHAYIGASGACWALYGEVLAREYGDPAYAGIHQLTADTYAVQHPGQPERRSIQSVALHLITLCLVIEDGADPSHGSKIHKRLAHRPGYHWLEPPRPNGSITVADVRRASGPDEHRRAVRDWADDVWAAWSDHHATVRAWIRRDLGG